MKTLLRKWNTVLLEPASEEATLRRLDGYNKTRYSRRKNQEGLLEVAAREAHDNQNVYFVTILNDEDKPYCAIESNVGYFGLQFLQDNYADFLHMQYDQDKQHPDKLFLSHISLFEHELGTDIKKVRIDFIYELDGSFSVVIYKGEAYDGTYEEIMTEYPPIPSDELEKLWVKYPKFGEYEQLFRLDRIPLLARKRILEYTDKGFPPFREYLQKDIEQYQSE